MGRLGLQIANVLLASLCCFQVAAVVNKFSADALVPRTERMPATQQLARPPQRRWEDRAPILRRNLFGAKILADPGPPEPELELELEATRLPIKLIATVFRAAPAESSAAISERGAGEAEVLFVGDQLARHPAARVAKIERGRIILQNGARREELLLSEEETAPAAPVRSRTASRRSARRSAPRTSRRAAVAAPTSPSISDRLKNLRIGGEDGNSALDLFSQARITPKWGPEGEISGMEVRDITPGSLYEKIGLSEGDVIESFNGIKLDSNAAGALILTQLGEAESFELVLSDGTVKTLRSDEISGLLSGRGGANGLTGTGK